MPLAEEERGPGGSVDRDGEAGSKRRRWRQKLLGMLLAILCFEMGLFLVAFPWSRYWSSNFFAWLSPQWHELWVNPFCRGAVSGLGLVNLGFALLEVLKLNGFRLSRPRPLEE